MIDLDPVNQLMMASTITQLAQSTQESKLYAKFEYCLHTISKHTQEQVSGSTNTDKLNSINTSKPILIWNKRAGSQVLTHRIYSCPDGALNSNPRGGGPPHIPPGYYIEFYRYQLWIYL